MLEFINDWCRLCELPHEASITFREAYTTLTEIESRKRAFDDILREYEENMHCDFDELRGRMLKISSEAKIHEYTAYALMYICMQPSLKKHYQKRAYPEEIYISSSKDVSYHARACKLVKGVWGTFTPWHSHLCKMEVLGFGRLQFQPMPSNFDYFANGYDIRKGETYYLNVHIPRTTTPLCEAECDESIKRAAEFFRDKYFDGGKVLFHCHSWLLFSEHKNMLSENSNIRKFMERFHITDSGNYGDYSQLWRLFDMDYNGDPDSLPANSSLRRAYIDLLKKGKPTGWGRGVFYY